MKLEIKNASCGYGNKQVLQGISLEVESGDVLCLLGPNGSGKTTLLKSILGFLRLQQGTVCLDGQDISSWPRKKLAQVIGYIPQAHNPPFPFRVLDVVVMGRAAYIDTFQLPAREDVAAAREALSILKLDHLAEQPYTAISGGERQLVLIARALAQKPQILVMDEPTSNLDFGNQIRVLEQIAKLANQGLSIVMATHFPNHAFICAQKVALVNQGTVVTGPPEIMITETNLKLLYQVNTEIVTVTTTDGDDHKICVPMMGAASVGPKQLRTARDGSVPGRESCHH